MVTDDLNSFLTKGSQVEVSSDEDGLNGAWFVATVIQPPPSVSISISTGKKNKSQTRNNLVYVEYHNLLTEDGSSRRLREYANVSYVRPSPHRDVNASASDFQLNDLVDAFYRDGWWTGIITQVLDNSNFVVNFQNPPDQIQFHFSDLRVHRKWVAGRWVQPDKQRTAGLMFTVGKKVEVSFDTESLRDVWFPATVLKNSGNNSFLVEYQQPGVGDLPASHKVTVDYHHIRPSPPHLRDKNFVLLEKVDAYYDFGWWSGVITKELADNRYNVFFKHTKKEREFIYSRVRPHMEWKGGKWFNTSQGDTDGRTTCSLLDKETTPTLTSIAKESSTVAASIMKRTDLDSSNDKNSMTLERFKDEIMSSAEPSKKTNIGQSDSEVSVINDQAFGKTENLSHGKKVRSKRGKGIELETPMMNSSRKKGRLANELRSLKALGEGAHGDSVKTRSQENVEKEDVTKDLGGPVLIGLQCNGKKLEQLSSDRIINVAEGETKQPSAVMDKDGKEGDTEFVAPKRKRGRPPRLQAITAETLVTVNHENGDAGLKEVGLPTSSLEENQNQVAVEEQHNAPNPLPLTKDRLPNENRVRKRYSSIKGKRGKRRTISINTDSLPQDAATKEKADGNLEKDSATRNPERKSMDTMSDDQPLSRWLAHSPMAVNGPERSVEQSSERRLEIVSYGMVAGAADENLPFVRSTPLWQTIESMEAFRKIPQRPHFRPLLSEGVKESSREGLAIGCMVTFSTVVDKTCGLRLDDPRSVIEDCLEALVELESHGFDVEVIRERLTGLLLIKDKQEELEEQSKRVGEKLEEQKLQEKVIDEEIGEIDRQIRELEGKRSHLLVMKETKDSEIDGMKGAGEGIRQQMREIGLRFDGLAAAPFTLSERA